MAYDPTTWVDEVPASSPVKYTLKDSGGVVIEDDVTIEVKTVITTEGTPLNAVNLNKIETGIDDAHALAATAQAAADTAQADADKGVYLYGLRDVPIFAQLNDDTALTNSRKAYVPIPSTLNGGTIIGVSGRCKNGSSSGDVVMTLKNGATAVLSTDVTIEAGETSSLSASTQPAIGASNVVATDDLLEVSIVGSNCGVGVTFAGMMIYIRPFED